MAKGQKRSNKEIKKPKAAKGPAAAAPPTLLSKKTAVAVGTSKKKG